MCRYGARGPIAEARLSRRDDGRYAYETKKGVTLVLRKAARRSVFGGPVSDKCDASAPNFLRSRRSRFIASVAKKSVMSVAESDGRRRKELVDKPSIKTGPDCMRAKPDEVARVNAVFHRMHRDRLAC